MPTLKRLRTTRNNPEAAGIKHPRQPNASAGFLFRLDGCSVKSKIWGEEERMRDREIEDEDEADALCKECGHAFKVYIDRITTGRGAESAPHKNAECPVCGCGECRIGQ